MPLQFDHYTRRTFFKRSSSFIPLLAALSPNLFLHQSGKSLINKDDTDLEKIARLLKQSAPVKWVFTGDSITQGAKHTYGHQGYPEIFEERIRWEMRRSWDLVINSGINGTNTSSLLHDFDWCIGQFKPAVVSLMYGTNDCQAREIPGHVFEDNLNMLTDKIRGLGAVPILQTPNPVNDDQVATLGTRSRAKLGEYVEVIKDLAERKRVILVDNWSYWKTNIGNEGENRYIDWLDDPLHPNATGHLEIARLLFKQISIFDPNSFTCSGKK
ncbi:MAG: SGNH/GDSL hydrolase family protein [Puia sp.]